MDRGKERSEWPGLVAPEWPGVTAGSGGGMALKGKSGGGTQSWSGHDEN